MTALWTRSDTAAARLHQRDPARAARERRACRSKRRRPASTSAPSRRRRAGDASIRRRSPSGSRPKRPSRSAAAIPSGWCSGPTRCSPATARSFTSRRTGRPRGRSCERLAGRSHALHSAGSARHRRAGGRAASRAAPHLTMRPLTEEAIDALSRPRRARCAQKRRRLPGRRVRHPSVRDGRGGPLDDPGPAPAPASRRPAPSRLPRLLRTMSS